MNIGIWLQKIIHIQTIWLTSELLYSTLDSHDKFSSPWWSKIIEILKWLIPKDHDFTDDTEEKCIWKIRDNFLSQRETEPEYFT